MWLSINGVKEGDRQRESEGSSVLFLVLLRRSAGSGAGSKSHEVVAIERNKRLEGPCLQFGFLLVFAMSDAINRSGMRGRCSAGRLCSETSEGV